jgi:hypothetical protein
MLLGELLCMYCVQHGHHGPLITAGGDVRAGVVDALEPLIQLLQLTAHHLRQGAELGFGDQGLQPQLRASDLVDDLLGLLPASVLHLRLLFLSLLRELLAELQLRC